MRSILVVDDETRHRDGLIGMIRKAFPDWRVSGAEDGEDAVAFLAKCRTDIVISDIHMPNMNGLELIERLSERSRWMKVIMLTGYAYFDYAKHAIRYGACEYILKPYDKEELLTAIRRAAFSLERERSAGEDGEENGEFQYPANRNPTEELVADSNERKAFNGRLYAEGKEGRNESIIHACCAYIEANYMEDLSLDAVATRYFFNPSYFSTFFKQHTGQSFSEYIQTVRIREAKAMLLHSSEKIQDISSKVGYKDTGHFIKLFKRESGITPAEYRRLSSN